MHGLLRRLAMVALAAVLIGVTLAGDEALDRPTRAARPTIVASSQTPDTTPRALLTAATSAAQAQSGASKGWRRASWTSSGESSGARLELRWPRSTPVSRVALVGADTFARDGIRSGVLSFSDGSSLQLTADDAGDLDVDFPRRTIHRAVLTVETAAEGAEAVSLSSLRLDDRGSWKSGKTSEPKVVSALGEPGAALDGDLADGRLGKTWSAGSVPSASVDLRWRRPRVVASASVLGIEQAIVDPAASTSDPVRGELVFSDGSRVPLPGISGGESEPTVVAFTPRVVTGLRVRLTRLAPGARIGLRELGVYDVGTTPPRAESRGAGVQVSATPATCDPERRAARTRLVVLCPLTGTAVDGTTTIVVRAEPGSPVTARAWLPARGISTISRTRTDGDGIARLEVEADQLQAGPLNIGIVAGDEPSTRPFVYAQMVNTGGRQIPSREPGKRGMTLQWSDDFRSPLSISRWGEGATYAAVKPEFFGGGAFGDAVFAEPEWGEETQATDDGLLRLRAKPIGDREDPNGWGRRHLGAIVSSMRVGGSGFSAQHGYFEARMLGAPGKGTWPAFWMLDSIGSTQEGKGAAETDAVELYGHSTLGSCHTVHTWVADPKSSGTCPDPNGFDDWALAWHTYGVQIVPGGADFYIDGELIKSERGQDFTDRPMYFLLDLALGGGWPVDLAATDETADLWVDWVRVYT